MKFYLVGGKIKFLTHKVEWQWVRKQKNGEGEIVDVVEDKTDEFYDMEKKDALLGYLAEREITPTVTEYDQPSAELLAMCDGRIFNSYDEALIFIETGAIHKTELQILQETVDQLVLAALGV